MALRSPGVLPRAWLQRISEQVHAHRGLVVVEAPPGYGKRALYGELSESSGATVLDAGELPLGAGSSLIGALGIAASDPAAASLIVVIGRHVDLTESNDFDTIWIGPEALALNDDETIELATLVGSDVGALAPSIRALTGGWPSYTEQVLRSAHADRSVSIGRLDELKHGPHVEELVTRCTRSLSETDREAFGQLAHLDQFTEGMADSLAGDGAIARARASGLAVSRRPTGWYAIAEPVGKRLRDTAALSRDSALDLAPLLVAEAGVVRGSRMLLVAGHPSIAAAVLGAVPVHELDDCEQTELTALLRTLLDSNKDDGSLHLRLARSFHNRGELAAQRDALGKATTIAREQLRFDHALEAEAELLMLDLASISPEAAADRHAELAEEAKEHSSVFCRIRLREIEAALMANDGSLAEGYRSISIFNEVADEWEVVGEKARAAATLRLMTGIGHSHLGTYADGIASMERACSLVSDRPQSLAKSIEGLARIAALAADSQRFCEAASTVERLSAGSQLSWTHMFHAWSAMVAAGFSGDAKGVNRHHPRATTLLGDLADHQTAVVFHAESAIAYALVGEAALAFTCLKSACEHQEVDELEIAVARVTVEARVGDAGSVGELISRTRREIDIPLERDWRLEVEALVAEQRSGASIDPQALASVIDRAEEFGLGKLVRSLVESGGLDPDFPERLSVSILGAFHVERADRPIVMPEGNAMHLVKMLAVHGKRLSVDVIVDSLWPDADLSLGRRRLKNVVNRARSSLGRSAVVRSGDGLELGGDVVVDLQSFRSLLSEDISKPSIERATDALNLYRGPLLESDVYTDWFTSEREMARVAALRAFTTALKSSEVTSAWAVDAVSRIQPDSEDLYLDVAELALQRNERSTARECIRLASDLCRQLGLIEPTRLSEVRTRLAG